MVSRLTHVAGGLFTAVLFHLNPVYAVAGAVFPDLDYPLGSLHRKLLHNVWTVAFLYYFGGLSIAVGALSHLVLDSLTPRGVNWFWPVPFPRIRGPLSTGSFLDYLLGAFLLAVSFAFLIW